MKSKVTVVGAGNVGATTAQQLFSQGNTDLVLVDIVEGLPQGKALDILESGPALDIDSSIIGTNSYEETQNSNIVVITSGIARKPGMSRDDLLTTNRNIVSSVVKSIVDFSPNSILIIVTNPLDAMAQQAFITSKFPKNQVIGMAGILDTSRFRSFIAAELKVSVDSVRGYVLGGHGDTMVPLIGTTTIGGVPITDLLSKEKIQQIITRTQNGGLEIVELLKTGSAYYAPAASIVRMVNSIMLDKNEILPCTAYLEGEYDIHGLFVGVPVKLGKNGITEIIEMELTKQEHSELKKSSEAVRTLIEQINS